MGGGPRLARFSRAVAVLPGRIAGDFVSVSDRDRRSNFSSQRVQSGKGSSTSGQAGADIQRSGEPVEPRLGKGAVEYIPISEGLAKSYQKPHVNATSPPTRCRLCGPFWRRSNSARNRRRQGLAERITYGRNYSRMILFQGMERYSVRAGGCIRSE